MQGAFFVNEKPLRVAIGNRHYDSLMDHVAQAKEFLKPKVVVTKPAEPEYSSVLYRCDSCGHENVVKSQTHVSRGCPQTFCNGTQWPTFDKIGE